MTQTEKVVQSDIIKSIFTSIFSERVQQNQKWGEQNHNHFRWLAILVEETGEIGKALLEGRSEDYMGRDINVEEEIIQVAAVCVAWLECIKRSHEGNGAD